MASDICSTKNKLFQIKEGKNQTMKRLISITTLGLLLSFSNISLAETKPQALELWNVLKVVHESNPEILSASNEE